MTTIGKHLRRAGCCLATLLLINPALAQREVDPDEVGLSAPRLQRIAELMQRHIDARDFAGAVTIVARDNQIAWQHTQGSMDISAARAMEADTVFRIMSMTKPVVAVSALIMVEEGKLRLGDPVSMYIPELGQLKVAGGEDAERDITIRDLLTHSSGLMSGPAGNNAVEISLAPGVTLADVIPQLGAAPLEFQPGTRWAYSPMYGLDVVARVVEITSGQDFDSFTRERIFEPLGMHSTYFYHEGEDPKLTKLYHNQGGELVEAPDMPFANGSYLSGGGGLHSSARDYLQFALALLNDGAWNGYQLLGERTVEIMRSAHLPDTLPGRSAGEGYGLGVRVVTDSSRKPTWLSDGSFGWSGAFNTHFFIDPEEDIVGIYMTQVSGFPGAFTLMDDFETAVMQAIVD
ncbi:MAG TPA: beta-lactamase family protein [Pseudomonadaceae bacterium]|nr:beta-lactamase family protein [Pseudomonadaceae bacterium]